MTRLRRYAAWLRALAFPLALLLLSVRAADAAGVFRPYESDGLRIVFDSDWITQAAPGYIPIRLEITNTGPLRTIEILDRGNRHHFPGFTGGLVRSPRRSGGIQVGTLSLVQRVTLARGSRVSLTIPVPVSAQTENYTFEIREEGKVLHTLGSYSLQSAIVPDRASALMVVNDSSALAEAAEGWSRSPFPPGAGAAGASVVVPPSGTTGRVKVPSFDLLLEPHRLPTNWLGFTSLRAVLIGPAEWRELSDAQRTAVRTWVACGGDLLVIDGDLGEWQGSVPTSATSVPYLLGRVHAFTSAQITTTGLDDVLMNLPSPRDGNWALPANRAADWDGPLEQGFRMVIPGVGMIHARTYILILLLFAVLIGPVNVFVLWKRRQQALLVLTVPAIALAFILLLAGYVVAGEGFGVYAKAASITLLDQGRQQAATRATVSMYAAGRSPRGGVSFSRDTAVIPAGGAPIVSDLVVDLTDTQRMGGLVRARTPANFETVAFRTARERLVVHRQGDRIEVVNGLGDTVNDLTLYSGGVHHRLTSPLGKGERGTLVKASVVEVPVNATHPYFARFASMMQLSDESYVAVMARSPFWASGVESVSERDSVHVVVGILEP